MSPSLCIFSCHNFHEEVAACIKMEGWTDVVSSEFPSRCGRPPVTWQELRNALPPDCTHVIVFGRTCIGALGPAPDTFPPVRLISKEQCFHLIAGQTLVDSAISDGAYVMTPAWVRDWRSHIAEQGFTPATAGEFYRDFATRLVFLDTGVDPDIVRFVDEFSQSVGLPVNRFAVGLDSMRLMLGKVVLEWRLEQLQSNMQRSQRAHSAELADHVAALDLLSRLTELREEVQVITAIEDLFRMLFAPRSVQYQSAGATELQLPNLSIATPYAWTADGRGFSVLLIHDGQELGRLLVDGLSFPQYRDRYLNMALAMTGVCGLAVDSARTRKRLVEVEKMASLAVMVAGVAHEINTPVGVGVLAASTLQRETLKLTQSFAARSMTQSSLQTYFGNAQSQVGLILSNLERVSKLIDAFRQVAVNGLPQTKSPQRLARCIRDVVASLGDRFNSEGFSLTVHCEELLEVESYTGDWVSIFTNLISNSLQHGFRERTHGHIEITVRKLASKLQVCYADDGVGLTSEARKCVFDPFFTTDMQHGMGLGMHLVYNIVTLRMGGTITCNVRENEEGALFHIEVPMRQEGSTI